MEDMVLKPQVLHKEVPGQTGIGWLDVLGTRYRCAFIVGGNGEQLLGQNGKKRMTWNRHQVGMYCTAYLSARKQRWEGLNTFEEGRPVPVSQLLMSRKHLLTQLPEPGT